MLWFLLLDYFSLMLFMTFKGVCLNAPQTFYDFSVSEYSEKKISEDLLLKCVCVSDSRDVVSFVQKTVSTAVFGYGQWLPQRILLLPEGFWRNRGKGPLSLRSIFSTFKLHIFVVFFLMFLKHLVLMISDIFTMDFKANKYCKSFDPYNLQMLYKYLSFFKPCLWLL